MAGVNDSENRKSPRNFWVEFVSAISVSYLVFSLISPMFLKQGQQPPRKIEVPDLLLISIVLLFNSGLINRLEDFGISKDGSLTAKFKDLKQEVATLSGEIDNLLLGTVLDAFEYITLRDLEKNIDNEYQINPSGYALLERLRNRGLIKEKSNVLADRSERKISLNKSFSITDQGKRYLKAVDNKGIGKDLVEIAERRMHEN